MSVAQQANRTTMKALAGLAGLTLAATALAGCGGSTPNNVTTVATGKSTQQARPTPSPSNADVGSAAAQVAPATTAAHGSRHTGKPGATVSSSTSGAVASSHATDRVARAHGVQHARSTPSQSNDDLSNTGARGLNPCTLVTASEARSITAGAVVGTLEAPLGPTCIYRSSNSKAANITMTVESLKLSQVTHRMSKSTQFSVKSHPAYCGRLGPQMLFVPLANGQVLNVVAPCSVARQFAALA